MVDASWDLHVRPSGDGYLTEHGERAAGGHVREMFDRAHDHYVAVETALLRGRPA